MAVLYAQPWEGSWLRTDTERAQEYFFADTTIRMYVYIKIYEERVNGTRAMLAASFLRSNVNPLDPVQLISFGTAPLAATTIGVVLAPLNIFRGLGFRNAIGIPDPPCDQLNLAEYQLNLPVGEIFHDSTNGIPQFVPPDPTQLYTHVMFRPGTGFRRRMA